MKRGKTDAGYLVLANGETRLPDRFTDAIEIIPAKIPLKKGQSK